MLVDEIGLRQFAQEECHAAAAADIGLERLDLGRVEPLDVEQEDRLVTYPAHDRAETGATRRAGSGRS